jgi:hypothetical protein
VQVLYRHKHGETTHAFKFVADFECAAHEALALAREFDLVHSWNHMCVESRILRVVHDFELTLYAAIRMPWPLSARQAVVHVHGLDCLTSDSAAVCLFASSPEHEVRRRISLSPPA